MSFLVRADDLHHPTFGHQQHMLRGLLFARLLSVVDPRTSHSECNDPLGLVVDDSGVNSLTLTHALQALVRPIMLVRHPTRIQAWAWPGQGGTSSMSPRSCSISQKSTFKVNLCQERYLLCVSAPHLDKMGAALSGALLYNLHHASPSELVWVFRLAYNRVGNSCSYS